MEGLLDGNGGDNFELDRFLSPPPELAEDWMNDAPTANNSYKENMAGRDRAAGNIAAVCTVNSDTPRRSENAVNGQSDAFRKSKQSSRNGGDRASRAGELGTVGAQVSGYRFIDEETRDSLDRNIEDGLNRACLHPDRKTRDVRKGKDIGGSIPAGEVRVEDVNHDSNSGREDGVTGDETGNELIRSWGLKDPCVATMMLKRMKRLRRFHTSEVRGDNCESISSCFLLVFGVTNQGDRSHGTLIRDISLLLFSHIQQASLLGGSAVPLYLFIQSEKAGHAPCRLESSLELEIR